MVSRIPDTPDVDPPETAAAASPSKPRRRRRPRLRVRRLPVSVLPTMLTLGNVLCGFVAVFFASRSPAEADLPFAWRPLTFAAGFIFLGMVFDALDGRVARLTNSTSELGEQLDSMADMVTFGVAPAFIAVQLVGAGVPYISGDADFLFGRATLVIGCVYVACAALRLARYTVEARAKRAADPTLFSGLPSPGAAGTVAALVLLHQHVFFGGSQLSASPWVVDAAAYAMVAVLLLTALAMVSKLPYAHVMNRYIRDRAKVGTVACYAIVGLLLMIVPQWSLAVGFTVYALSAPVAWVGRNVRAKS